MLGCTLKVRFSLFFNPDLKITLSPLRDRRHDQTVSPQHAGRSTCDKPLKIIPRTEMSIMFPRDSTLCQLTEARKLKRINLSATEQETSQLKLYTNCLKYVVRRDYFLCKIHWGIALCNRQDKIFYLKNCFHCGTFFGILRHKINVLEVINHNTDKKR